MSRFVKLGQVILDVDDVSEAQKRKMVSASNREVFSSKLCTHWIIPASLLTYFDFVQKIVHSLKTWYLGKNVTSKIVIRIVMYWRWCDNYLFKIEMEHIFYFSIVRGKKSLIFHASKASSFRPFVFVF